MPEEPSAAAAASLLLPEASDGGLVLLAATLAGTVVAVEVIGAAVGGALAERVGGGAGARRMGGFRWLLVLQNNANTYIKKRKEILRFSSIILRRQLGDKHRSQHRACLHANHSEAMAVELAVSEAGMRHN